MLRRVPGNLHLVSKFKIIIATTPISDIVGKDAITELEESTMSPKEAKLNVCASSTPPRLCGLGRESSIRLRILEFIAKCSRLTLETSTRLVWPESGGRGSDD